MTTALADPLSSIGTPGSTVASDGRQHCNGGGQKVPCPKGMLYYLSADEHMWIPLWTRYIDMHGAAKLLPEWTGAYPRGGGA